MLRNKWIKRLAVPVALAGSGIAILGATAFAAGPYAYDFGINGGGAVACTSQTRTASTTLAPYIEVELTSTSPSSNNSANFTAANTNCVKLSNANWQDVVRGDGYYSIYAGDYAGQNLKLMGGTGPFQSGTLVEGYWKL